MDEIASGDERNADCRQDDQADQNALIGLGENAVRLGIRDMEVGTFRGRHRMHQTRLSSSTVPNSPHGRQLITARRMRNGTASASVGLISRAVR